jgi:hypothetical protein
MSQSAARPKARSLCAWEILEARRVFGNGLRYEVIRIHEGAQWPCALHRLHAKLKGLPTKDVLNAITLGNHLYFPIHLPTTQLPVDNANFYLIPWLIHELTHVWQYQQMGWRYLFKALGVQARLGSKAYAFGGEAGLLEALLQGKSLADFNLEQQGDIAREYYRRLARGSDVSAYLPFVSRFQNYSQDNSIDYI